MSSFIKRVREADPQALLLNAGDYYQVIFKEHHLVLIEKKIGNIHKEGIPNWAKSTRGKTSIPSAV